MPLPIAVGRYAQQRCHGGGNIQDADAGKLLSGGKFRSAADDRDGHILRLIGAVIALVAAVVRGNDHTVRCGQNREDLLRGRGR